MQHGFVRKSDKWLRISIDQAYHIDMEKVERPTELGYLTMGNYVVDSRGERVLDFEEPIVAHIDYQKFLDAALNRIQPDGTIDVGISWKPLEPRERQEISRLSDDERDAQLIRLAQVLRIHSGMAVNCAYDPEDQAAYQEGEVANEIAPFVHEPEFLRDAATLAAESKKRTIGIDQIPSHYANLKQTLNLDNQRTAIDRGKI